MRKGLSIPQPPHGLAQLSWFGRNQVHPCVKYSYKGSHIPYPYESSLPRCDVWCYYVLDHGHHFCI